ncbi:hypothetical protein SKAU_G00333290 [Synaphobranchus kaupii]|uniref:Ig-like domain-containing protein n=1 Tax=Synaphobranchus kaupii TaxID=118154 RepID=A0A9Q1IGI5_SYNKA|nr:hypothetical protein SKAU_G00333290 [Synaphobranchus kaupii]
MDDSDEPIQIWLPEHSLDEPMSQECSSASGLSLEPEATGETERRHRRIGGIMDLRWYQCPIWIFCLLLVLYPGLCLCLSVQFPSEQPVYVIPKQSLVLEARIDLADREQVAVVTWERELEGRTNPGKVKVAEFPEKASDPRITTEQQGATLRLRDFRHDDRGIYTVTVTSRAGPKSSAARTVREYEAVHHVSVAINVSHSLLLCGEAWGTDPHFSWLHEKVALTEEVGRVSADGTVLYLSAQPCGHFTCIVSNSLGHSSATYTAEPCERQGGGGTAVGVAFLVILLICGGVLAFFVWRRHWKQKSRGERLREPDEEQL